MCTWVRRTKSIYHNLKIYTMAAHCCNQVNQNSSNGYDHINVVDKVINSTETQMYVKSCGDEIWTRDPLSRQQANCVNSTRPLCQPRSVQPHHDSYLITSRHAVSSTLNLDIHTQVTLSKQISYSHSHWHLLLSNSLEIFHCVSIETPVIDGLPHSFELYSYRS